MHPIERVEDLNGAPKCVDKQLRCLDRTVYPFGGSRGAAPEKYFQHFETHDTAILPEFFPKMYVFAR